MGKSRRVEFKTFDGTILRGDFFQAKLENAPFVIMTQGLTLLKEHFIDDFAVRFQAAGFAVLVYDHRGYGSSEGTPRSETNPWQQAEDYSDAVTFASSLQPYVDPSRVCIWGVGHSGGAAMIAASSDQRLKAVILLMPFRSGAFDAKNFPKELMDKAWEDRAASVGGSRADAAGIPIWPDTKEQALATDGSQPLFSGREVWDFIDGSRKRSDAAGTSFANKLTLQSFIHISKVDLPHLSIRFHHVLCCISQPRRTL